VVKFMGDAALVAWPAESADAGANALLALKRDVDFAHEKAGLPMRLLVRANAGPVCLVLTGPGKKERLDLFGETVNTCAMLECHGVSFAPGAFRALEPETRKAFKKHTPAVRYIALDEPHRDGKR
jgi:class 3 adenylate cyclase